MHHKRNLVITMLLFGSIGIFINFIDMPSAAIVQWRAILGTLFLGLLLLCRRQSLQWAQIRKNILPLGLAGVGLGANWVFLFEAYTNMSVGLATIIYYFAPILVFIFAPIFFKERLTKPQWIGVAAAMVGMICINGNGLQGGFSTAMLCAGMSAILYATVMMLNKCIHNLPSLDITIVQLFISAVVISLYCFATTGQILHFSSAQSMVYIVILGVVHTGFAYMLYFGALQDNPPQDVAILSYIDPASAVVFAFLFLGETLAWPQLLGGVLILGGTLFAQLKSGE